jgi:hypothetical protein
MTSKKLPLPLAVAWIVGSTFVCSGTIYSLHKWLRGSCSHRQETFVTKIIQTCPQRDRLSSLYLESILGLSQDHPITAKELNIKHLQAKLLELPMIKKAHLELLAKDTIYIDYLLREPIAKVYDFENIACDEEGYLFPLAPFYSPKALPEIYFGALLSKDPGFFTPLPTEPFTLALTIIKSLDPIAKQDNFRIQRVDVSSAFCESLGRQEIIMDIQEMKLGFQEDITSKYIHRLRLSPKDYPKQLGNYLNLHKELTTMPQDPLEDPTELKVIDLRIEGMAYIPK